MVHFVLVHGSGHGAWCWYKIKPLLESAGHRVKAVELAASGINMAKIEEVHTMADYTQPLIKFMDSLPTGDKVTLVGHSFGGFSVAFAMDRFPHKISAAVFLTACMPDSTHSPSYILDQFAQRFPDSAAAVDWLDTRFSFDPDPVDPKAIMLFGPKFLASSLYRFSSSQDLALAEMLIRPGSLFREDLSKREAFSKVGYGSVNRVYIVVKNDLGMLEDYQRWMIENNPVKEVMEIEDADHMPMLSKPNQLCSYLLDIANKYT